MGLQTDKILGLNIGGTLCSVVIGDVTGEIDERIEWPSGPNRRSAPMLDDLLTRATGMLQRQEGVVACGVAIGGPLDSYKGIVKGPPNLPGWDDVPLREIVESKLAVPTRVEHDATACALAEVHWGAGKDAKRLAYFTCGTGFGAGFVFDGEPYCGANGYPSDVGHIRLRDDGPVAYGKTGTVEAFCAASALGKIAAWKFPERWPEPPESEQVATLATGGDAQAKSVIEINASAVGEVCALVGDLLHTDLIVLGSLAQYLGGEWLELVKLHFDRHSHPITRGHCNIVASSLGRSVQEYGALAAALRIM